MRIEKVNENQIRCTLTREDLADRQIKLSELAYGSDKAKSLFRDMMQQASNEFGFEANDIPLMVEAIPISAESIILVITKVEYPEELDTRFSKFSEEDEAPDEIVPKQVMPPQGADDILGWFKKLAKDQKEANEKKVEDKEPTDLVKLFTFKNLGQVRGVAQVLSGYYNGQNDLYKESKTNEFVLVLHKSEHTPQEFNKVCNIACEYGTQRRYSKATEAHFMEHEGVLIKDSALQTIAKL